MAPLVKSFLAAWVVTAIAALFVSLSTSPVMAQEIPDQLKERIHLYTQQQDMIKDQLRIRLEDVKTGTPQQRNEVVQRWRTENAEQIQTQRALGDRIRLEIKEQIQRRRSQLEQLPAEEQNRAMQAWMSENAEYLSMTQTRQNTMNQARDQFRNELQEEMQQTRERKMEQRRDAATDKRQQGGSGTGKDQGRKGGGGKG